MYYVLCANETTNKDPFHLKMFHDHMSQYQIPLYVILIWVLVVYLLVNTIWLIVCCGFNFRQMTIDKLYPQSEESSLNNLLYYGYLGIKCIIYVIFLIILIIYLYHITDDKLFVICLCLYLILIYLMYQKIVDYNNITLYSKIANIWFDQASITSPWFYVLNILAAIFT